MRRTALVLLGLVLLGAGVLPAAPASGGAAAGPAEGFPEVMPAGIGPSGYLLGGPGVRPLAPDEAPDRSGFPWPVGERLVYEVSYFGVPVGLATIEYARNVEVGGRALAHLVAHARTNDVFSRIYSVSDRHEAWVDLANGHVLRTRTRTQHASKETREEIFFDWDTHFVLVRKVKVHKHWLREASFDFGPHVYDVFDAFYALRSIPVSAETDEELPVYASRKVHGFRIKSIGPREAASPVVGVVDAWELRPYSTIDGREDDVGNGRVIVWPEARNLPLRLEGWFRATRSLRIGGVVAELVGYEPGDPAWREPPPATWSSPAVAPESVEGRPRWEAPAAVRAAREARGVETFDRKSDFHARAAVATPSAASR